jgi:hypothetical protein
MVKKWRKRFERYEQVRQDMRRLGADPDEIMDMALMLAQLGVTREQLPELARTMLKMRIG